MSIHTCSLNIAVAGGYANSSGCERSVALSVRYSQWCNLSYNFEFRKYVSWSTANPLTYTRCYPHHLPLKEAFIGTLKLYSDHFGLIRYAAPLVQAHPTEC